MISRIYTGHDSTLPETVKTGLKNIVAEALEQRGRIKVFFRADDIGPPSANYTRMMEMFIKYRTPLCLAVVPAWMTRARWKAMDGFIERADELFCWHMHGYMHRNHETRGKKQEFGPERTMDELFRDLSKGKERLESILAGRFTPVFTPPWNRCSREAMVQMKALGFKAVSRSFNSRIEVPVDFKDLQVHIDLHTRKESSAETGWENLLNEFKTRLFCEPCGIMLHHMRMNDAAFIFLEFLLELFAGYDQVRIVDYRDLI